MTPWPVPGLAPASGAAGPSGPVTDLATGPLTSTPPSGPNEGPVTWVPVAPTSPIEERTFVIGRDRQGERAPEADTAVATAPRPAVDSATNDVNRGITTVRLDPAPIGLDDLDDLDDGDVLRNPRRRVAVALVATVAVLVAGVIVLRLAAPGAFDQLREKLGLRGIPAEARAAFDAAGRALQTDTEEGFDQAREAAERARQLAGAPWPAADAMLARVLLARARHEVEMVGGAEATDLEIRRMSAAGRGDEADQLAARLRDAQRRAATLKADAYELARAAHEADPGGIEPNAALALYYLLQEQAGAFEERLRAAEAAAPESALVDHLKGAAGLGLKGTVEEAVHYLKKVTAAEPDNLRARYDLATAYRAQRKLDEAKATLDAVLQAQAGHARARMLRDALEPRAVTASAKDTAPAATSARTPAGGAGAGAGFAQLLATANRARLGGNCGTALPAYEQATALRPGDPRPRVGMGWCFVEMGGLDKALEQFKKAHALDPSHPESLIGLAEVYKEQGARAQAREYYQKYLDVAPHGSEAAVARNMLDSLK
jgi:tetratricopeptide (TPR) repeat protein